MLCGGGTLRFVCLYLYSYSVCNIHDSPPMRFSYFSYSEENLPKDGDIQQMCVQNTADPTHIFPTLGLTEACSKTAMNQGLSKRAQHIEAGC